MTNVYIKTVEGGENTNPDGTDALMIDDGTNSEYVQINNLFNGAPTTGDIIYFNGTKWVRLTAGTDNYVLTATGAGSAPAWEALVNSFNGAPTTGDIIYYDGTKWNRLAASTDGYVLTAAGAGVAPAWEAASSSNIEGALINGRISVTVAANDITVALKTWAGADPSAGDPVKVYINGNERSVTAALSVTLADGTAWMGLTTPFAALEQNFFVYLSWRAASSVVVIGFSRIPYATVYSDFSATTTNEKHGAFSTAPASTDDVVNVGRFAATLSASASYNWSVPTFTSANLIQKPTFETEWMYWLPAPTGYSSVPTNTIYLYKISGKDVLIRYREQANGTSNATTITQTAPFTAQTITNGFWQDFVIAIDNSAQIDNAYMSIASGSATISSVRSATGAWTNSGGKRIASGKLTYPISA